MKKQQAGFTLIELIAVIVILGILSAVAVPRFVNLQDSARQASLQGVAAALGSASALNYSADLTANAGVGVGLTIVDTTGAATVATARTIANNLLDAGSDVSIGNTVGTDIADISCAAFGVTEGSDNAAADSGDVSVCTLTSNDNNALTATFNLYWAN